MIIFNKTNFQTWPDHLCYVDNHIMHQPTPDFELLYILFAVKKNISRFSEKIQKSKIERFSKIMKYKERMRTPLFSAHTSANLNPSSLSLSLIIIIETSFLFKTRMQWKRIKYLKNKLERCSETLQDERKYSKCVT